MPEPSMADETGDINSFSTVLKFGSCAWTLIRSRGFRLSRHRITINDTRDYYSLYRMFCREVGVPKRPPSLWKIYVVWFTLNSFIWNCDHYRDEITAESPDSGHALDIVRKLYRLFIIHKKSTLDFAKECASIRSLGQPGTVWKPRYFKELHGGMFPLHVELLLQEIFSLTAADRRTIKKLYFEAAKHFERRFPLEINRSNHTLRLLFGPQERQSMSVLFSEMPTIAKDLLSNVCQNLLMIARQQANDDTVRKWENVVQKISLIRNTMAMQNYEERTRQSVTGFCQLANEAGGDLFLSLNWTESLTFSPVNSEREDVPPLPPKLLSNTRNIPPENTLTAEPQTGDDWAPYHARQVLWFKISDDGTKIWDTTCFDGKGGYKYRYEISKNNHTIRNGMAFFFSSFERTCVAHQEKDGSWVVDQNNDFDTMDDEAMHSFISSIRRSKISAGIIPDLLVPEGDTTRSDGKQNNPSGKYRIDPRPGSVGY